MSSNTKITLKSSDGDTFEVDLEVAVLSLTIKRVIEDVGTDDVIPVFNVDSSVLPSIFEVLPKLVAAMEKADGEALKVFDPEYFLNNWSIVLDMLDAAKYLEIKCLYDIIYRVAAGILWYLARKMKTLDEIREILNVEVDFSPEEEEEIHRVFETLQMTGDNTHELFKNLKRRMSRFPGRNMRNRRQGDE